MSGGSTRARHFGRSSRVVIAAATFLLILAAVFTIWGFRGSVVFAERSDPARTYKVEFVTASNIERCLHPSMDMPGIVRLIRVKDGKTIDSSQLVDFFGGGNADVIWLIGQNGTVQVGRDVVFRQVPRLVP